MRKQFVQFLPSGKPTSDLWANRKPALPAAPSPSNHLWTGFNMAKNLTSWRQTCDFLAGVGERVGLLAVAEAKEFVFGKQE